MRFLYLTGMQSGVKTYGRTLLCSLSHTTHVRPETSSCYRTQPPIHRKRTSVRFLCELPLCETQRTYGRTFSSCRRPRAPFTFPSGLSRRAKNVRTYVLLLHSHQLFCGMEKRTDVRFRQRCTHCFGWARTYGRTFSGTQKTYGRAFFSRRRTPLCSVKTHIALLCHYNAGLAKCFMQQGVSQGVSHFTSKPSTDIKTYGRSFLCTHHSTDPLPPSWAPHCSMSAMLCRTSWK